MRGRMQNAAEYELSPAFASEGVPSIAWRSNREIKVILLFNINFDVVLDKQNNFYIDLKELN